MPRHDVHDAFVTAELSVFSNVQLANSKLVRVPDLVGNPSREYSRHRGGKGEWSPLKLRADRS